MGELTVKLDEEVLAGLSRRAAEHGRSMGEEAQHLLTSQLLTSSLRCEQEPAVLAMLAEARRQTEGMIRTNTLELVQEGRDELA